MIMNYINKAKAVNLNIESYGGWEITLQLTQCSWVLLQYLTWPIAILDVVYGNTLMTKWTNIVKYPYKSCPIKPLI